MINPGGIIIHDHDLCIANKYYVQTITKFLYTVDPVFCHPNVFVFTEKMKIYCMK